MVITAVAQNGDSLQFASEDLKGDQEVVRCAINQNGTSLRFASQEIKNEYQIV